MGSNELRRGNLVYIEEEVHIVDGIQPTWVWLDDNKSYYIDEVFPIQLTEEWLIKFGFKDDEPYSVLKAGLFEFCWYQYKNKRFLINNIDVNINYVHQLQNLFFALTGSELVLKPIAPEAI